MLKSLRVCTNCSKHCIYRQFYNGICSNILDSKQRCVCCSLTQLWTPQSTTINNSLITTNRFPTTTPSQCLELEFFNKNCSICEIECQKLNSIYSEAACIVTNKIKLNIRCICCVFNLFSTQKTKQEINLINKRYQMYVNLLTIKKTICCKKFLIGSANGLVRLIIK